MGSVGSDTKQGATKPMGAQARHASAKQGRGDAGEDNSKAWGRASNGAEINSLDSPAFPDAVDFGERDIAAAQDRRETKTKVLHSPERIPSSDDGQPTYSPFGAPHSSSVEQPTGLFSEEERLVDGIVGGGSGLFAAPGPQQFATPGPQAPWASGQPGTNPWATSSSTAAGGWPDTSSSLFTANSGSLFSASIFGTPNAFSARDPARDQGLSGLNPEQVRRSLSLFDLPGI